MKTVDEILKLAEFDEKGSTGDWEDSVLEVAHQPYIAIQKQQHARLMPLLQELADQLKPLGKYPDITFKGGGYTAMQIEDIYSQGRDDERKLMADQLKLANERAEALPGKVKESILKHLKDQTKEMEGYSYYGSNPGVAEDDYENVADAVISDLTADDARLAKGNK